MTERSVKHATFTIERTYGAQPQRVFAAWADPEEKGRWFGAGQGVELDFREGGREHSSGAAPNGDVFSYDAVYLDIVPDQRIVYTYDMHLGDARISVSVVTVEFGPAGSGTQLTYTEQGVFLDGLDDPAMRESGTGSIFDALGAMLEGQPAGT